MRRLLLILFFVPSLTSAQTRSPDQDLVTEFDTVVAASRVLSAALRHTGEKIGPLVQALIASNAKLEAYVESLREADKW